MSGQEGQDYGLPPHVARGMSFHMEKETSPHIGHHNHLCDMAERGEVSLEQMKEMVKDPKFICKKCGRAANSSENLCEPVSL